MQYVFGKLGGVAVIEPQVTFVLPDFVTTETTLLPGDYVVETVSQGIGNYSKIVLRPECTPASIYGTQPCDALEFYGPIITSGPFVGQPEFITYWPFADGAFAAPGTYFVPYFSFNIPLVVTDLDPPQNAVPEPMGASLVALGLAVLGAMRLRRTARE